ncbi:MAG: hypothetical protein JRF53_16840 [Deltaproteobacteria bacterium]|nr:hypothetical protein [Deltaproteobacteria bacterium]
MEDELENQIHEFINEAKKRNIGFNDLAGCLDSIILGTAMTSKEKIACDFLGEPETFWNPAKKYMDYNWFRDNKSKIEKEFVWQKNN